MELLIGIERWPSFCGGWGTSTWRNFPNSLASFLSALPILCRPSCLFTLITCPVEYIWKCQMAIAFTLGVHSFQGFSTKCLGIQQWLLPYLRWGFLCDYPNHSLMGDTIRSVDVNKFPCPIFVLVEKHSERREWRLGTPSSLPQVNWFAFPIFNTIRNRTSLPHTAKNFLFRHSWSSSSTFCTHAQYLPSCWLTSVPVVSTSLHVDVST